MAKKGRPPHEPTEETRAQVLEMASNGLPIPDIATRIGISHVSLIKHYREELDGGTDVMVEQVQGALFRAAMEGSVSAQIFIMKARKGWSEKVHIDLEANVNSQVVLVELPGNGREPST